MVSNLQFARAHLQSQMTWVLNHSSSRDRVRPSLPCLAIVFNDGLWQGLNRLRSFAFRLGKNVNQFDHQILDEFVRSHIRLICIHL